MGKLTKKEAAWVRKLKKVLDECPSERLGSYTIGDNYLCLYDNSFHEEIIAIQDSSNSDFGPAIEKLGADLGVIYFPFPVESTAG